MPACPTDPRHQPSENTQTPYDLLIIGGGINGSRGRPRGLRPRPEGSLWSRPTIRLRGQVAAHAIGLHGGLRSPGDLRLQAGGRIAGGAPYPQRRVLGAPPGPPAFCVPVYQGDKRPPWMIGAGMWLHAGLLAIKGHGLIEWAPLLGADRRYLSRPFPAWPAKACTGAAQYQDCQLDDARLVLENIQDRPTPMGPRPSIAAARRASMCSKKAKCGPACAMKRPASRPRSTPSSC